MSYYTRITRVDIPAYWAKRKPFMISTGNLRGGEAFIFNEKTGMLDSYWSEAYLEDLTERNIAFVVYSYNTPIAWVRNNGQEIHVSQKFSRTTSAHQSKLYHPYGM